MPTDVIMPQMGESIFEGTITKWLKKPGDRVEKDEPLFEISTDKVDAEIPSPAAGILTEIKALEGDSVGINAVVAIIGEAAASTPSEPQAEPAPQPPSASKPQPAGPQPAAQTQQPAPAPAKPPALPAPGATDVVMPQMGESIFEGTITKWLKKTGDQVEKDEPLFEISTDKVDAEIPSPAAGILIEIKAPEGATIQINAVVARIGAAPSASSVEPEAPPAPAPPTVPAPQAKGPVRSETPAPAAPPQPAPPLELRSSPLVRRIAKENNVNLAHVLGSGAGGRITKEDILHHLSRGPASEEAPAAPQPPQIGPIAPLSRMRAIIGQRMVESLQISPHAHTVYRVDMTRVARLRERERAGFEQRNGVRLTYMPFIAAAAVQALQKYAIVNASLVDGAIHYHPNIHLGIAVALDGGLIVPVIRQAEGRSFADLARAVNDLALRARAKKLNPDEVSGSTFTLTNSGVFGGEFGTPIINQPESAILAIGGLRKEPVVLTDAEGNDTIAIRSMQYYCMGFDHRIIDGADAGKFMSEFKNALENWNREIG
jgi:2-oxoglutarate dehydrogenase E2 component (dihydrolipoamide succinyltransferase)